MHLLAAAHTDIGLRRDSNEDSFLVRPDLGLFAVADGMGGHAAGEVASRVTIETVAKYIDETTAADGDSTWPYGFDPALGVDGTRLKTAIRLANHAIATHAEDQSDTRGMATTAVVLLVSVRPPSATAPAEPTSLSAMVAHVGDSRLYLWRDGQLDRLTSDHSWVEEQVRAGLISPAEARVHPWRNLVTRAISGGADPEPEFLPLSLEPGDRLLLCTDGLTGPVPDDVIASVMGRRHAGNPDELCRTLVDAANAAGGPDNVTVVMVEIEG